VQRIVIIIVLFCLVYGSPVLAQVGNDFPFSPGIAPWNQPQLPTPSPGYDYVTGRKDQVQLNNRSGAKIVLDFVLDWWGLGPLLTSIVTSGNRDMKWNGPDSNQGNWRGWCLRCEWEFFATTDNVVIGLDFIGSDRFGAHLEIKEVTQPLVFAALSQADKDQLWQDAAKMGQAFKWFTLIAATAKSFGQDQVSTLIAQLASAAALGAKWAQAYLEAEAADPWDDAYGDPFDAPFYSPSDLGFEYCGGTAYCNDFANTMTRVQRNGDGAYVSLNRAGTCAQVGNSDCAQWQGDRARWYLREQGDAMRDAGYFLWMVRDNTNDIYSPECDCWLSNALYQAAGDLWDSGEYLRNRY
jgi:hypothetical protein